MSWPLGKANTVLILDTHVLLWFLYADPRLGAKQLEVLNGGGEGLYVSAVSSFEVTNKMRIGKLPDAEIILHNFLKLVTESGFEQLPITFEHARLAGELSSTHKDPFDRFIAAQAIIENLDVMTVDSGIRELGARVVW
jgi:PIN domain nuclease of toxin-antitoxin system